MPALRPRTRPIVKLVSMLMAQAILDHAATSTLTRKGKTSKVRYRIDGVLTEVRSLPREMHAPIVSRIKIMAIWTSGKTHSAGRAFPGPNQPYRIRSGPERRVSGAKCPANE